MTAVPVAVVAVGDELLLGEVVDTNSGEIGRRLASAGGALVHVIVVRDDIAAITDAVRDAASRASLVVVTGGLGPTTDDLTDEALALLAAGAPLQTLANPVGTAPGLLLTLGDVPVVAVPGVPAEMRALVEQEVVPRIAATTEVEVVQLLVPLLGETDVAQRLSTVLAGAPATVRVAYLAAPGMTRVRFVGPPADVAPLADGARVVLGPLVGAEGDETLAATVVRALRGASATVATAESLTGGLVGAALTAVPGASAAYRGGVVAYATDVKRDVVGVEAGLLQREGAVHADVAEQLAAGVRRRLCATYGVATTGVAGPEPQDGRPVGTVHVAVVGPAGARVVSRTLPRTTREAVREWTVNAALDLLRRAVLHLPCGPGERDV